MPPAPDSQKKPRQLQRAAWCADRGAAGRGAATRHPAFCPRDGQPYGHCDRERSRWPFRARTLPSPRGHRAGVFQSESSSRRVGRALGSSEAIPPGLHQRPRGKPKQPLSRGRAPPAPAVYLAAPGPRGELAPDSGAASPPPGGGTCMSRIREVLPFPQARQPPGGPARAQHHADLPPAERTSAPAPGGPSSSPPPALPSSME